MFKSIGVIRTPFREKFGVPSGSMRVASAEGVIELFPPYNDANALDGLEGASHLWIIYLFHKHLETEWRPKVRPPRLGGEKKVGVFATRSPVRPNPIGLTCVSLLKIEREKEKIFIHVRGVDMVDETPILDIKPYQKEADCYPEARLTWTEGVPWQDKLKVNFKQGLEEMLTTKERELFVDVLSLDPRPSRQRTDSTDENIYKLWLGAWDISWRLCGQEIQIIDLQKRPIKVD